MYRFKKLFVLFLAAVLSISAAGCAKKTGSDQNSLVYYNESNPYESNANNINKDSLPKGDEITGTIGKNANCDDVEVNLKRIVNVCNDSQRKVDYIVCEFDFSNKSSETIKIESLVNFYVEADSVLLQFPATSMALLSVRDAFPDIESMNTEVQAGKSVSGYIALEIPENWSELKVMYYPLYNESGNMISYKITSKEIETL